MVGVGINLLPLKPCFEISLLNGCRAEPFIALSFVSTASIME